MNIEEVEDIVALMGRLAFDGVFISVVRRSQMSDDMWALLNLDACGEQVQSAMLNAKAQANKYGISFDSSGESPMSDKCFALRMCCAPWEHVYIGWDGSVYPCCQFQSSLGNCVEDSFTTIWHGAGFEDLRQQMLDGDLPVECRDCMLPWSRMTRCKPLSTQDESVNLKRAVESTFLAQGQRNQRLVQTDPFT
jgi:radical SAM protein with 4Fe4S-binding SPASM domain